MGNANSNWFSTLYEAWTNPEIAPDLNKPSTHDAKIGLENRKERVSHLTEEQMSLAGIPAGKRDYCAHLYLDLTKCQRKNFPFVYRCAHEKHEYSLCQYDDFLLRMKEYERERRLLKRDLRRKQKGLDEETPETS